MTKNYYEILNSSQTDTMQKIKENYQKLILQYHPDKQHDDHQFYFEAPCSSSSSSSSSNGVSSSTNRMHFANNTSSSTASSSSYFFTSTCQPSSSSDCSTFIQINEAWNVLRNPIKRKLYDAQFYQNTLKMYNNVFAELDLSEFHLNDPTDVISSSTSDIDNSAEDLIKFYYYTCRCGGSYLIDDLNIFKDNEIVTVECDECSLVVNVTNKYSIGT